VLLHPLFNCAGAQNGFNQLGVSMELMLRN